MRKMIRVPITAFIVVTFLIAAACVTPPPETGNRNMPAMGASNQNAGAGNQNMSAATPAESGTEAKGSIRVESTPPGAEVMLITEAVGGASPPEPRGTTPTTITDLAPGTYTVHLEKPGYKFFQKTVMVKEGKDASVVATLKK